MFGFEFLAGIKAAHAAGVGFFGLGVVTLHLGMLSLWNLVTAPAHTFGERIMDRTVLAFMVPGVHAALVAAQQHGPVAYHTVRWLLGGA